MPVPAPETVRCEPYPALGSPMRLVRLGAVLGAPQADALRTTLLRELGAGARQFIIDLGKTHHLDASSISTLIFVQRKVNELGGRMLLVGVAPEVLTLLRVAHAEMAFSIQPGTLHAIAALGVDA